MSGTITDGQWREFWTKVERGQINRASFQAFMDAPETFSTPNLEGLSETFEVTVEGRTVTCAWIPANYFADNPTNKRVIDEIKRRHLRCPSRQVAVAAFDRKKSEMATNPSVAIDGVVQTDAYGSGLVGYVDGGGGGRGSFFSGLHGRWDRNDRFLVVVSE